MLRKCVIKAIYMKKIFIVLISIIFIREMHDSDFVSLFSEKNQNEKLSHVNISFSNIAFEAGT